MAIITPSVGVASLPLAEADVTNLTTDLAAKAAKSTLTTKGDIYVATASGVVTRLAVGANGTVLTADSGETTGLKYAAGGGSGIPQGGPLTADLVTDDKALTGTSGGGSDGASLQVGNATTGGGSFNAYGGGGAAGQSGGGISLQSGSGDDGDDESAAISVNPGDGVGGKGRIAVYTNGSVGAQGQALVSDSLGTVIFGGVQSAAGVPSGAPTGLPFAYDSTAVTGGFYFWNGAAWVKLATIL